jgi:hypothetical protein
VNLPMFEAALDVLAAWDDPTDDECCVFAADVLAKAYGFDKTPNIEAWHLWDIAHPWSPVEAAQHQGIATHSVFPGTLLGIPFPGRWHLVQGWRGTPGAPGVPGHTFLWLQVNETHGLCLDSSDKRPASNTLNGFRPWLDRVAEFKGGVAVAVLRPFGR